MSDMADDLAALLDEMDIRLPICLCGLSMGGYIAWQFWSRYPDRLSRLILCDTRAVADSVEVLREVGCSWLKASRQREPSRSPNR